jgi:hypothetical protein
VKELTSEKVEFRGTDKDKDFSNMDFKTRLNIKEVCAHACMEFINEVVVNQKQFRERLVVVDLINRMKRLRVSEDGKAREGVEQIFKGKSEQDERNWLQRFTGLGMQPRM